MEAEPQSTTPWAARAGLIVAVLAVASLTLTPAPATMTLDPFCLICGERGLADVILNIALFIPLGLALGAHTWPPIRSMAIAVAFTTGIECAQIFIPGRDASPSDILFNTLGAALGIFAIRNLSRIISPTPRLAPWLPLGAGAAAAGIIVATGALLQPDFPPSREYIVEWTPRIGGYERFEGEVKDVHVGDERLPEGRVADVASLAMRLLRGDALTITGTTGGSQSLAALFSLRDRRRREIWVIEQTGSHVVLGLRTTAARARLQQPELRFHDLMSLPASSPFTLAIARTNPGFRATIGPDSLSVAFRPHDGWRLLWSPSWFPTWVGQLVGVGWIMGLVAPLALWSHRSVGTALGVALVVGSFALTTRLQLLAQPGWVEAAGLGLASIAAILFHRYRRAQGAAGR